MARWIGPGHDHIDAVLAAADAWRERCFVANGSLFGDENLWTLSNLQELRSRVVDNPIEGKDPFVDKLEKQLESASPEVRRLAAEILWFLFFFPNPDAMGLEKKLGPIKRIWEGAGSSLPDSEYLDERVLRGVGQPGTQYNMNRYQQFEFLIQSMERWKTETRSRQTDLMKEDAPWGFAEWLDQIEASDKRPMRNVILYFLFPDHMERWASPTFKNRIAEAFKSRIPEDLSAKDKLSSADLDRALYAIRKDLQKEYKTEHLDFYHAPLRKLWDPDAPSDPSPETSFDPYPKRAVRYGDSPLNTILYGPPGTGKTYATARHCVKICDGEDADPNEAPQVRYRELVKEGRVEFVTFHQSYGYEEFVQGLRPVTGSGGGFDLEPRDGVLKRIADRARRNLDEAYVLVIDEINRANVSKVLGELVTLLEEDKREGEEQEIAVTLPYSKGRFTLPANLHILGTMNTADRSIALLDTALRRRFSFEEVPPKPELLEAAKEATGIDLPKVLSTINDRLEWFLDRNHLIGHAWLMGAQSKADVDRIMHDKIVPLIAEYFHNDRNKVRAVLGGSDDFVPRKSLSPPPGVEDDRGEDRYRWPPTPKSFADGAYDRLVAGSSADDGESGEN